MFSFQYSVLLVSLSVDCRERRQTPGASSIYGRSYISLHNSEASRQQSATHKIDIDDVSSVLSALTCSRSRRLPVDASYSRFVQLNTFISSQVLDSEGEVNSAVTEGGYDLKLCW